jgi:4-carboxymuconolactone decarboxylase
MSADASDEAPAEERPDTACVAGERSDRTDFGAMLPRIAPIASDDMDERQRLLLDSVRAPGPSTSNIFTTLVRHPGLFRKWLPFGGKLLAGRLPARDRELLILRTGCRCQAEYEWAQHIPIAVRAGVTATEVDAVTRGPDDPVWDPFDAALLRAADELHSTSRITDDTWAILAARYDERQLIEVPMVVGHYHMVAFVLNSLGVPLEDGVAPDPRFDGYRANR